MTHKHSEKLKNFIFLSAGCSLLKAEGFSCSLDTSKLQLLIKKKKKKIVCCIFSSVFGHQNPGSGLDPDPDSLEMPDPYPDSMNPVPQLCLPVSCTGS